jgi:hypothetical protein
MEEKKWYDGILSLFSSRKFWLAILGVVQTIVFQFFPNIPDELWQAINTLLLTLIGAIAVEDAAKKLTTK